MTERLAVHVLHPQVAHDEVVGPLGDAAKGGPPIPGHMYLVPLHAQQIGQNLSDPALLIDDEDPAGRAACSVAYTT